MSSDHLLRMFRGAALSGPPLLLAMVMAASSSACSLAHMKPPAEVGQGVEEVHVAGLPLVRSTLGNEDFRIGLDSVTHVSRGLETRDAFRTFFGFESHAQTGYAYDVDRGAGALHGECGVDSSEKGTKIGRITFRGRAVRVACACGLAESGSSASLVVGFADGHVGGTLTRGAASYQVTPIHAVHGGESPGDPAGYRVDGDAFVGAVDILSPGHVWLDKTLEPDERARLDCIFAGLFLYVPVLDATP